MQATGRLNDTTDLPRLKRKGSLLKLTLHIALPKVPQVTTLARRGAV